MLAYQSVIISAEGRNSWLVAMLQPSSMQSHPAGVRMRSAKLSRMAASKTLGSTLFASQFGTVKECDGFRRPFLETGWGYIFAI